MDTSFATTASSNASRSRRYAPRAEQSARQTRSSSCLCDRSLLSNLIGRALQCLIEGLLIPSVISGFIRVVSSVASCSFHINSNLFVLCHAVSPFGVLVHGRHGQGCVLLPRDYGTLSVVPFIYGVRGVPDILYSKVLSGFRRTQRLRCGALVLLLPVKRTTPRAHGFETVPLRSLTRTGTRHIRAVYCPLARRRRPLPPGHVGATGQETVATAEGKTAGPRSGSRSRNGRERRGKRAKRWNVGSCGSGWNRAERWMKSCEVTCKRGRRRVVWEGARDDHAADDGGYEDEVEGAPGCIREARRMGFRAVRGVASPSRCETSQTPSCRRLPGVCRRPLWP